MAIDVQRGGATSRYWYGAGSANIRTAYPTDKGVEISIRISGNKGGTTQILCTLEPDTFAQLAGAMMTVAPVAATKAFASALAARDASNHPEHTQS